MIPSQQYTSVSRRALDVEDYIDIVRRHLSWIMGPLFAGLVISCVVAFLLPNTYVSSAMLRITPPQISESLVQSTVSQQMGDRIAQMQQDILSRGSLSAIIQKPALDLYKKDRESTPLYDVIEKMRGHISIVPVNLSGNGNRPAAGIQIAFQYPDRYKAQAVVSELMTRFMESMVSVTGSSSKVTSDFLKDEITQAKTELTRLDNEITQFKVQNPGRLPEELQMNMQALVGLQQQMAGVNDAINRIAQDKLTLQTSLDTLKTRRDTYQSDAMMTVEGSAARVQNERLGRLNAEITEFESKLRQLQEIYIDSHPDIRNLKLQLAVKKKERDELQAKEEEDAQKPKPAPKQIQNPNPFVKDRIVDIQGQIDGVLTQMRNLETERLRRVKQLDDINQQMGVFQSRISQVPANQQRYVALEREYSLAQAHYLELQRRVNAASLSEDVDKRKAGEQLEVLENASLPESPTNPKRGMITGIGVGIGLMVGVFLTGIKEVKDTSLKNLKDVRAYTNLPILSSIPLLENDLLVRRKRRITYVVWSASIILGMVLMSASMYYYFFVAAK